MLAAMTPMAPTPPMPRGVRLTHIRLLPPILVLALMKEGQHARNEEEHDIHNAKGETGLLHGALLVGREVQAVDGQAARVARDGVRTAIRQVGALLARDVAEGVDTADEGADEEQVDEGYEAGVGFGSVGCGRVLFGGWATV